MALGDAYATAVEYRAAIDMTDTGKDADILKDLKAVSRFIEGKVGRFFNKDADNVARVYYAPANTAGLWVDDLTAAPASIKVDYSDGAYGTTLESGHYLLWPFNADKGPEPRPYTRIKLSGTGRAIFREGERIEVTGIFGWPEVPIAVNRATLQLTAILRLESARATRRIPELGDIIEASPDAMHIVRQLLDNYKRERYV